jgi:phosphatidylglycerophosphate synthase
MTAGAASLDARLEGWSRVHACLMLAGAMAAAVLGRPWPIGVVAVATFGWLIALGWGAWTASGRFGVANGVTVVRLATLVACALGSYTARGELIAALVLGVFALDAIDGWLARRTGSASAFGAHFDMETDALLVLTIDLLLWQRGTLGAWIMTTGLLRYVYVLFVAALPGDAAPMPKARWARAAFGILVIGLVLALALESALGAFAALLGTALVTASFARSFHWSWLRAKQARPQQSNAPGR